MENKIRKTIMVSLVSAFLLFSCAPQGISSGDKPSSNNTELGEAVQEAEQSTDPGVISEIDSNSTESDSTENGMINTGTENQNEVIEIVDVEDIKMPDIPNRLPADQWQEWPVVPEITETAILVYQRGLKMGNNPHAFSKVGDCQSIREVLLGVYDLPERYMLSDEDLYLQDTINNFSGSFNRDGMAVKGGFNAASVLSPLWADPDVCKPGETPLECEYRVHNPSIVIISLEVWWEGRTVERYKDYMRTIIEDSIEKGIVPILSTKADNVEGDHSINLATAELAEEYDLPLWNFWLAAQPLPYHGIDPARDGFHISTEAWNVRSLTALKSIDVVWKMGSDVEISTGDVSTSSVGESSEEIAGSAVGTIHSMIVNLPSASIINNGAEKYVFGLAKRSGDYQDGALGVYLFDTLEARLYKFLGDGYHLHQVNKNDGSLLVSNGRLLYWISVDGLSKQLLSDSFYQNTEFGAYWAFDQRSVIALIEEDGNYYLESIAIDPSIVNSEDGNEIVTQRYRYSLSDMSVSRLYYSADHGKAFFDNGSCESFLDCELDSVCSVGFDNGKVICGVLGDLQKPEISVGENHYLFASRLQGGIDSSQILMQEPSGSYRKQVELAGDHVVDLSWSNNGEKLAVLTVMRSDYSGKSSDVRVFTVRVADLLTQEFTSMSGINSQVFWSPDNNDLLIMGTELNEDGVYILDARTIDTVTKRVSDYRQGMNLSSEEFFWITNLGWLSLDQQ